MYVYTECTGEGNDRGKGAHRGSRCCHGHYRLERGLEAAQSPCRPSAEIISVVLLPHAACRRWRFERGKQLSSGQEDPIPLETMQQETREMASVPSYFVLDLDRVATMRPFCPASLTLYRTEPKPINTSSRPVLESPSSPLLFLSETSRPSIPHPVSRNHVIDAHLWDVRVQIRNCISGLASWLGFSIRTTVWLQ